MAFIVEKIGQLIKPLTELIAPQYVYMAMAVAAGILLASAIKKVFEVISRFTALAFLILAVVMILK